jgi:putative DNA primase/helicase
MAAGFVPDPSLPSILELAIMLWGQPTGWSHDRNEARFGARESKSVLIKELVWRDHEAGTGGGYLAMHKLALGALPEARTLGGGAAKANGQTAPGKAANGHAGKVPPWQNIGKRYGYLDAAGRLVLEVVRTLTGSPRFLQRRPDPTNRSGWKWSLKDIPRDARPLYRLPALLASGSEAVWVCEGEKDADNLTALGLIATTAIGGTGGGWRAAYNGYFAGKPVVILPDNDPPGRAHAAIVARALFGVASSVKVLALPGLPEKGDVTDWLTDGGDRSELEWLALEAPLYVPPGTYSPGVAPSGGAGAGVAGDEPELDGDIAFAEAEAEIDHLGPPPPPEGDGRGDPLPDGQRVITCVAGELPRMVRQAEAALIAAGEPIYQRGVLVRPAVVEYDAATPSGSKVKRRTHAASLVEIKPPAMLRMLSRVAVWQKYDARARRFVACDPPAKVVEILLASRGEWSFPTVRGILTAPTIRTDGSLLTAPGYDPDSHYFLAFPSNLVMPDIPEAPTKTDAEASLARLDKLLDGYEFLKEKEAVYRAVAQGLLMTQVLRCGMDVSPMQAVSATSPGSGKSHLVDLGSTIATGRWCPVMNAGRDDNETEKGINTKLISGVPGFSIDNVHKTLNLEALNTATERPLLQPRNFGTLTDILIENGVVIYMTGNNLDVADEQIRRTMLCKMDVADEQPEQRRFPKGDPIQTVLADRGRYIADILIIARAYLAYLDAGGEPPDVNPYGSFPDWDKFVRQPLIWLRGADPLDCQDGMRAEDPVKQRRISIIEAWRQAFGNEPKTLAEVARFAMTPPTYFAHPNAPQDVQDAELAVFQAEKAVQEDLLNALREAFPAGKDGINTLMMAGWMRRFAGRKTEGWKLVKADDAGFAHGLVKWKLVKI